MGRDRVEVVQLDLQRKWEYLRRYYDAAGRFYEAHDEVVSESDIDECIRNLKARPAPVVRKSIALDRWHYRPDEDDRGVREGFFSFDYDERGWEKVRLPHAVRSAPKDPVRFGKTDYVMYISRQGRGEYCDILKGDSHAWYKSRIPRDQLDRDKMIYLDFRSVNLQSDVWVNEYPVMTSHLGLFPFQVEISEEARSFDSADAVVAVRVSNTASNVPGMFYNGFQFDYSSREHTGRERQEMDWNDQSSMGIADEVTLLVLDKNHIKDAFIHVDELHNTQARLGVEVELRNTTWRPFRGTVALEISEWLPRESNVISRSEKSVVVLPMSEGKTGIAVELSGAKLWTPSAPNLYLAHVVLRSEDGTSIDDVYETFGVRTIRMKGSHFYLNGERFVPRGTHDVCHYLDEQEICPSDRVIVRDILLHKAMGATCSRWPSDTRMHYGRIADYCDQLGFLVSWTGYFEVWNIHPEAELLAGRDVQAMVRSLRNHPSIIVWEMGDEVLAVTHPYRRMKWFDMMYRLVEAEDRTRPIIPNGCYSGELMDIIEKHGATAGSMAERRRLALEQYPVYGRELAVWDIHHCPCLPPFAPVYQHIEKVVEVLGGQKPTIYTEFGTDGMPNPARIAELYGSFRWGPNPLMVARREDLDQGCYARRVTADDWRETQAYQAITVSSIIDNLRQHPEAFAGYYFVCMFDVWTFYWGAVDAKGKAKLLFFVASNCLRPVSISALHGNSVLKRPDRLEVTVSNYGGAIAGATLKVVIRDSSGHAVAEMEQADVKAAGDVQLTTVAEIDTEGLPNGLYDIEYHLSDKDRRLLAKQIEIAYFE